MLTHRALGEGRLAEARRAHDWRPTFGGAPLLDQAGVFESL
jgi:hypothetical protein